MTSVETARTTTRKPAGYYETFMSRRASLLPTLAAVAILILLFVGAEILVRGDFITPRNISSLLLDNAYLLILAVGMTFVIITGGIDLSVGSVMAFTGIWLAKLLEAGTSLAVAMPAILSPAHWSACSSECWCSSSTSSHSSLLWPACSSPAASLSS